MFTRVAWGGLRATRMGLRDWIGSRQRERKGGCSCDEVVMIAIVEFCSVEMDVTYHGGSGYNIHLKDAAGSK
uniref:Uncharacterized protein n=1 Tax=Triticum urartu TaxID=4572 RepID=A0A8R7U0P0_TRIUA